MINIAGVGDFDMDTQEYYRDDKWEPAPDILKNMKGSCSEFNYTLVL